MPIASIEGASIDDDRVLSRPAVETRPILADCRDVVAKAADDDIVSALAFKYIVAKAARKEIRMGRAGESVGITGAEFDGHRVGPLY